jgi:hypothetical protein
MYVQHGHARYIYKMLTQPNPTLNAKHYLLSLNLLHKLRP